MWFNLLFVFSHRVSQNVVRNSFPAYNLNLSVRENNYLRYEGKTEN